MSLIDWLILRPPVSRAAPQPEKLQKNNVTKKKRLVEVKFVSLSLSPSVHPSGLLLTSVPSSSVPSLCRTWSWITCLVFEASIVVTTCTTSTTAPRSSITPPPRPSSTASPPVTTARHRLMTNTYIHPRVGAVWWRPNRGLKKGFPTSESETSVNVLVWKLWGCVLVRTNRNGSTCCLLLQELRVSTWNTLTTSSVWPWTSTRNTKTSSPPDRSVQCVCERVCVCVCGVQEESVCMAVCLLLNKSCFSPLCFLVNLPALLSPEKIETLRKLSFVCKKKHLLTLKCVLKREITNLSSKNLSVFHQFYLFVCSFVVFVCVCFGWPHLSPSLSQHLRWRQWTPR